MGTVNRTLPFNLSDLWLLIILQIVAGISFTHAATTTLNPDYNYSEFEIPIESRTLEFDSVQNIYAADRSGTQDNGDGTGSRIIYFLERIAEGFYGNQATFITYTTKAERVVSGLDFGPFEQTLYVAEVESGGNAGAILQIDVSTQTVTKEILLPDFRATGIEVDDAGNILISTRKAADLSFGEVHLIPAGYTNPTFTGSTADPIAPIGATGIEKQLNHIYFATNRIGEEVPSALAPQSFYFSLPDLNNPTLIATFDNRVGAELRIGPDGALYGIGRSDTSGFSLVVKLEKIVPDPANTGVGNQVNVNLSDTSSIAFNSITSEGDSYVAISSIAPTATVLPFTSTSRFYDISTTAGYSGDIEVCLNYIDEDPADESSETMQSLSVKHLVASNWEDLATTQLDPTTNEICALTSSFSWFTVASSPPQTISEQQVPVPGYVVFLTAIALSLIHI